jgi:hypothetical protein
LTLCNSHWVSDSALPTKVHFPLILFPRFSFASSALFSFHQLWHGTTNNSPYATILNSERRVALSFSPSCPPLSYIANNYIFQHYSTFS